MRGFSLALLALTVFEGNHVVSAFTPASLRSVGVRHFEPKRAMAVVDMAKTEASSDVSIPYDSAARLSYDGWCSQYGKTFDAARYEVFKENYVAITVMNMAAKKTARETGDDNPSLLALNEYADCTADEYEAAMNGEEAAPSSTGGILDGAMEAIEAQMTASSALQDASDALAEEEEVGY
jgi:hypothetical protein